ncbi:MAG: hypothetical protein WC819_03460 [Parcubacteria group bacterium]
MVQKNKDSLNIRYRSEDWRGQILSNPATTPFAIGSHIFPSVESPLQGIKFADIAEREEIFAMDGMDALRAGREITHSIQKGEKRFVYWGDEQIIYNSIEHRMLIVTFIHEKIRQNTLVQEALLSTNTSFIFHEVGVESPYTSLPEIFFIEILLKERSLLEMLLQFKSDL